MRASLAMKFRVTVKQMKKEYWLNKWKSKDVTFHEQSVNPDLVAYVRELNLRVGDGVLVPLCGKSKDMLWLMESGFHVVGVEFSPIACEEFFA
jgi:thiopurine S-methyltransferase